MQFSSNQNIWIGLISWEVLNTEERATCLSIYSLIKTVLYVDISTF